jgi:hypothetical protein
MQPYFMPYAGYFRLFAATDLFVIYDCVQFPRRGWVHRNRLPDANGNLAWFTLPLAKAPREVLIGDLKFSEDAAARMRSEMRRFPAFSGKAMESDIARAIAPNEPRLVDYLERLLRLCCTGLGLPFNVVRSSTLAIGEDVRGADRILAIAKALGAKRYINAPGGRELYGAAAFARRGLELLFLSDYDGPATSILHRLLTERADRIGAEIRAQSAPVQ